MTQMLRSHCVHKIFLCTGICHAYILHLFMNIDFLSLREINVPTEEKKKIQIVGSICLLSSMCTFMSYLREAHYEISHFDYIIVHSHVLWALLTGSVSGYCEVELEVVCLTF